MPVSLWAGHEPNNLMGLDKNVLIINNYYGEEGTLAALEAHINWLKEKIVHEAVDEVIAKNPPPYSMATEDPRVQIKYMAFKGTFEYLTDTKLIMRAI